MPPGQVRPDIADQQENEGHQAENKEQRKHFLVPLLHGRWQAHEQEDQRDRQDRPPVREVSAWIRTSCSSETAFSRSTATPATGAWTSLATDPSDADRSLRTARGRPAMAAQPSAWEESRTAETCALPWRREPRSPRGQPPPDCKPRSRILSKPRAPGANSPPGSAHLSPSDADETE